MGGLNIMSEITAQDITNLKEQLGEVVDLGENKEIFDSILGLLGMPDEDFVIIAPGIMQSYQQSLNNPNDKIVLVQALNATGTKVEDLVEAFSSLEEEINKLAISIPKKDFLKEMISSIINSVADTEGIAKKYISIPIELCHEDAKVPQYAHISDSGMDVYAIEDVTVHPGETKLVPTGIKVALPPGYELQVRPKSGRALKTKMRVANSPGTIDQGYRDEIKVIIDNIEPPVKDITAEPVIGEDGLIKYFNITSIEYGSDFHIGKGEKFCQLVLAEIPKASFYRVDNVKDIGEDRGGGFGSTGIK